MYFIIFPLSIVLLAILMNVQTFAIGLVLYELTCIDISIGMIKHSFAHGRAIPPITWVGGSVLPHLRPLAMLYQNTFYVFYLACVLSTTL